jgi:hypothetical protein
MGLFFRPRRPLMRMAAGAATAGIAYNAGKRRAQQDEYNQEAAAAYQASQAPPPTVPQQVAAPQAQATGDPTMSELSRLAELHQSGQLSDAEYTAAKAKLLGL